MSSKSRYLLVLHQVQGPENLGAVARAMANFGFGRLVLSDPQTEDLDAARRMAVHSHHVLDGLRRCTSLREALQETTYACGTTFRAEVGNRRAQSPEEAAARLHARAQSGVVALVLGGERRGLSDEELGECDDFVTIPTDPAQPSMNLGQAAAVLLYVLARARSLAPAPPPKEPEAGRLETIHALEEAMRAALSHSGFLNPQAPDYVLRELLHSLRRGRPTQREVEMWTAAFKQLGR